MDVPILSDDVVLQEDVTQIAADESVAWDSLRGKTMLVTGSTGLIGGVLVRALAAANARHGLGMRILAGCRNPAKAEALFSPAAAYGVEIAEWDVRRPAPFGDGVDFIVHAAAETASRAMVERPVETILTAVDGTRNVLALARRTGAAVVYLSSMEIYGSPAGDETLDEHSFGRVDPLELRASYPESKRLCEALCVAAAHEWKVDVKITRLVQTVGAGVAATDVRVFAEFARSVVAGRDIVLRTDGSSARCYCYATDAVTGVLTVLLKGRPGEAYNLGNDATYASIREMAELLVKVTPGTKSRIVLDVPTDARQSCYAPPARLRVSSAKARALGWTPKTDLEGILTRLTRSLHG
ncbi:MAG: NAD-dependent epimerase/dehydratase family protein [Kiritimatiellae bacterium]|nr:NAD-dependent epimerase/dehydratase family protein [Kiritimatiellia bacterium]